VRARVTAAAALGAGLCTFAFRYLSYDSFSNDHFQHLARAQQMLFGAWPVRDYAESGLPLAAALSALAQVVFGPGLHAEVVWIAIAFGLAALIAVPAAARVSGSVLLGLAGVAVTVVAYPVSYSYPKVLPYAAALTMAWYYASAPSVRRLTLLAAAVVFGFLLRHDHGVILGVGATAALAVYQRPGSAALRAVATFIAVGLVLASPYLIWVQIYQGVPVYLSDGLAMSRREAEKATWTPPSFSIDRSKPLFAPVVEPVRPIINVRWQGSVLAAHREARERQHGLIRLDPVGPQTWKYELRSWSTGELRRLVRDPAVADTHGVDRSEFSLQVPAPGILMRALMRLPAPAEGLRPDENGMAVLYYLSWLLPCAAAIILWRRWPDLPPAVRMAIIMALVVQLLMNRSMLRDPLLTRARDVVAPLALLVPFVVAGLWVMPRSRARILTRAAAVLILVLTSWSAAAAGSLGERLELAGLDKGWTGVVERIGSLREDFAPPRERTGTDPVPIAEYLGRCTPERGRLLMMTFAPELLFFARRGFAGGHESLIPGFYTTPRHATLMVQRLQAEDVPFVVMDSETAHEMPASYPVVTAYVRERYREVARFPVAREKRLIVLADASRQPAATFGDQDLPCFVKP
jgi:hypothetical protein